jgi:hypothetical protein
VSYGRWVRPKPPPPPPHKKYLTSSSEGSLAALEPCYMARHVVLISSNEGSEISFIVLFAVACERATEPNLLITTFACLQNPRGLARLSI